MPHITARFYGRYLIAEPHQNGQPTGAATFLAPHMAGSPLPTRTFRAHHSFLTVTRLAVDRKQTTIQPSFRTMSDARARFAELLVWDLTGANVAIHGTPPFRLSTDSATRMVNLCEPVSGFKYPAVIRASGLKASTDGLTSTSVQLDTGTARAFASFDSNYNFVTESDARDGSPANDRRLGNDERLVDVVEVGIDTDSSGLLRVRVSGSDGSTGTIAIDASRFQPTVAFTNLCPPLPALPADVIYDIEFGRYYDYLAQGPADAPVPRIVGRGGDPGDCNQLAHVPYEAVQ